MIPFDRNVASKWGGEWVRREWNSLLWSDEFPQVDFTDGDSIRSVVRWADARRVLREAMDRE